MFAAVSLIPNIDATSKFLSSRIKSKLSWSNPPEVFFYARARCRSFPCGIKDPHVIKQVLLQHYFLVICGG